MAQVYVGMAAEILHAGHINLLKAASSFGEVTVGLLTDSAIAEYKDAPVISYDDRFKVISSIGTVNRVIPQEKHSYRDNLMMLKPDYVVHGDDWLNGVQVNIRSEIISLLKSWGGSLIEVPYTKNISTSSIKQSIKNTPLSRVSILKNKLKFQTQALTFIDLHSALSGLIAENIFVKNGQGKIEFDGMWASSLTDSTSRGKPDIEAVDISARLLGLQDTLEATTKPIIFDGDTGGRPEHFAFTVKSLERNGVSAVIIEDKFGLKRNSLVEHLEPFTQESIEDFCQKIRVGISAKLSSDFMIIARIESLILGKGVDEAIIRAQNYIEAGADGIMIHSRNKSGDDAFEFIAKFKSNWPNIPIVIVPTSFNHISRDEFWNLGVNIVIYANHLLRASYPAMVDVAKSILLDGKTQNIENRIMSMPEILALIPGTNI